LFFVFPVPKRRPFRFAHFVHRTFTTSLEWHIKPFVTRDFTVGLLYYLFRDWLFQLLFLTVKLKFWRFDFRRQLAPSSECVSTLLHDVSFLECDVSLVLDRKEVACSWLTLQSVHGISFPWSTWSRSHVGVLPSPIDVVLPCYMICDSRLVL